MRGEPPFIFFFFSPYYRRHITCGNDYDYDADPFTYFYHLHLDSGNIKSGTATAFSGLTMNYISLKGDEREWQIIYAPSSAASYSRSMRVSSHHTMVMRFRFDRVCKVTTAIVKQTRGLLMPEWPQLQKQRLK